MYFVIMCVRRYIELQNADVEAYMDMRGTREKCFIENNLYINNTADVFVI